MKKSDILASDEFKSRSITKYDAELLISQGLPLPSTGCSTRMTRHSLTRNHTLLNSASTGGISHSIDSPCTASETTDLTRVQSSPSLPTNHNRERRKEKRVPKLKIRVHRISETDTDSGKTDTTQTIYEILGADESSQDSQSSQDEGMHESEESGPSLKRIKLRFDGKVDMLDIAKGTKSGRNGMR